MSCHVENISNSFLEKFTPNLNLEEPISSWLDVGLNVCHTGNNVCQGLGTPRETRVCGYISSEEACRAGMQSLDSVWEMGLWKRLRRAL